MWTFTRAISDILAHLADGKDKVDIILVDRGIFDALCWFEWLSTHPKENPHLDEGLYNIIRPFVTLKMFTSYLDLVYVFKVTPNESLKREYANLLTEKFGSIMHPDVLKSYNESIDEAIKKYKGSFQHILRIDTSQKDPDDVSYEATSELLLKLNTMLIEKIGYFPPELRSKLINGINEYKILENYEINFENRDKVEESNNIQPIPIAVIMDKEKEKVLVVKKNPRKTGSNSPEFNRYLLYIGGHVRVEDQIGERKNYFAEALHREINEELGESIYIKENKPFLIYTPNNPKSKKHIAICYPIIMDLNEKKFNPTGDEFLKRRKREKRASIKC